MSKWESTMTPMSFTDVTSVGGLAAGLWAAFQEINEYHTLRRSFVRFV